MVGGEKNLFVRGDEDSLIGKSKKGGIVAYKTEQAIVIGIQQLQGDNDGRKVENVTAVVGKMADYLKEQGY
eukprot:CAMPEP_0117441988 /NCGR_PEP_ID=MMETSP0759-20121206/3917_1 /TAXON_ID=63605 /ORGANISM="Percolomonas cosmopolitus, Strain WS" /LENGTH=70 /DNA_ID=CAMNT_0005233857 /DNA_START=546 /DNA_END=758 /DNA_ORIENTATION=+